MTLYIGNDEVSQKIMLNQTVDSNLPEISENTKGKILSNNGSALEWVDNPNTKIIGSFGYTLDEVAPDGCVFCDGSEYEKAKFPDFYQSLVDNKRKSVDYATFDSSVSTNGSCGFFGLDTENEKFKVPMLKDVYLKAGQEPIIFGGESLPNITGEHVADLVLSPTGAFYTKDELVDYAGGNEQAKIVVFDASRSSPTYQNEAKVNPDYVAYKVFVVIYNTETEISESQTSEFLNTVNEINNKIDSSRTNCITKIPQDIKLELSEDGILTLKAGSKVYVPNGFEEDGITPKFDEIILDTNYSGFSWITSTESHLIFYNINQQLFDGAALNRAVSAKIFPESPQNGDRCYRTDENKIYVYRTNGWEEGETLPLGIIKGSGELGIVKSINQIFNGFGYIGSVPFILPNVEGLISNGINDNGSFISLKSSSTSVHINTLSLPDDNRCFYLFIGKIGDITLADVLDTREEYNLPTPVSGKFEFVYVKSENRWYMHTNSSTNWEYLDFYIAGTVKYANGHITLFNPKNVFQAVDRNDTEWASTASKPSNKYIDINISSNGSTYNAPANGWFNAVAQNSKMCNLHKNQNNENFCIYNMETSATTDRASYIPVLKGDTVTIYYDGTLSKCRFIYDEGSK